MWRVLWTKECENLLFQIYTMHSICSFICPHEAGLGVEIKWASISIISKQDKENIVESWGIGNTLPYSIVEHSVLSSTTENCSVFALSKSMLICMRFPQLVQSRNPDSYTYYVYGLRNCTGNVTNTADSEGKAVQALSTSTARVNHVALLDLYFLCVLKEMIEKNSNFYLKALPFAPTEDKPCFWDKVMPKSKLQTLIKDMHIWAGRYTCMATIPTIAFELPLPLRCLNVMSQKLLHVSKMNWAQEHWITVLMSELPINRQTLAVTNILSSTSGVNYSEAIAVVYTGILKELVFHYNITHENFRSHTHFSLKIWPFLLVFAHPYLSTNLLLICSDQ